MGCFTNFEASDLELRGAFDAMKPFLNSQLADQKVTLQFNPPNAPHFTEPVLKIVLIEVERIVNSKLLGYLLRMWLTLILTL